MATSTHPSSAARTVGTITTTWRDILTRKDCDARIYGSSVLPMTLIDTDHAHACLP